MMGGVALIVSFFGILWLHMGVLAGASAAGGLPSFIPWQIQVHVDGAVRQIPKLLVLTAGGLAIGAMGLIDDRISITPKTKFVWQTVIALGVALGGIRLGLFINMEFIRIVISALWLILLMNSFNLLDNMDGLSAGVGLVASLLFLTVALATGQYFLSLSLLLICGTLAGFLILNFHPAKIFMGDCGSQFLGYLIGVFTILQTFYQPEAPTIFPVLMPLIILAVPLYDTASVIVIRTRNGESIFKADTRHFSHRIKALGMSSRGTVLFLYLVTLSIGLAAPVLPSVSAVGAILLLIQAGTVITIVALLEYYGGKLLNRS